MAKVICAISGLQLTVSHIPMTLFNRELAHPIFYLDHKHLIQLYGRYCKGKLNSIDSYLLFLAILDSTDHIKWSVPVEYKKEKTTQVIANNIDRLITLAWKTDVIQHPSFKQPTYMIREDNCDLRSISDFLDTWQKNLDDFALGKAEMRHRAELHTIEEKLERIILSGNKDSKLAANVAKWASHAGDFPVPKQELWTKTIRSCFNATKMFGTDKKLLLEIRDYCCLNIEAGSLHFHKLMEVIGEGIANHNNYLGLGTLEDITANKNNYIILPSSADSTTANIIDLIADAPVTKPVKGDYPTNLAFIKAKLKYRLLLQYNKSEAGNKDTTELVVPVVEADL